MLTTDSGTSADGRIPVNNRKNVIDFLFQDERHLKELRTKGGKLSSFT